MNGVYPALTAEQRAFVRDIEVRKAAALAAFPSRAELAEHFDVSINVIHRAAAGAEYKHDRESKTIPRETTPNNPGVSP